MDKVVYIFVCGILTRRASSNNWTGKAVTHSIVKKNVFAEKIEYFVTPILRAFGQNRRIEKLRSTLNWYINNGFKVILICHSNGGDVALKALKKERWPRIEKVILFSPATNRNLGYLKNELGRNIGFLKILIGKKDLPLKTVNFLIKITNFLSFGLLKDWIIGYGTLGINGPIGIPPEKDPYVLTLEFDDYGHSDWFSDENFEKTMSEIVFND
jgi:pimeloyl-ACP methyl ester carboxylesterase